MNESVIKIFIGYDPVESIAWHTLVSSIYSKSTRPVSITPINTKNLRHIYKRQHDPRQSNSFSFTRFLVPHLCDYQGWAIFLDCDQLLRVDIAEIFNEIQGQEDKAVYVVKHDYQPRNNIKYLNNVQYSYPRKNWSSVILWNCAHPANRHVTPDYINTAEPKELHRFLWLQDEDIGELDIRWNWLVGEYDNPPTDVKNVHWTIGGPYFIEYSGVDFANEWFKEKALMEFCAQRLNIKEDNT